MSRQTPATIDPRLLLLLSIRPDAQPIHSDIEAAEYDWEVPCHFSGEQLGRLGALAGALAGRLAGALEAMLGERLSLTAGPVAQHYAHRIAGELAEGDDYRVLLAAETPCGLMTLNRQTAVRWVAGLLGSQGGTTRPADRDLSELEGDLLADIVSTLIGAIGEGLAEAGAAAPQAQGRPGREGLDLPGGPGAEYCLLTLTVGESGEPLVRLALACGLLDAAAGAARGPAAATSPERAKAAMTEHFARYAITGSAILGRARLRMQDVMDLSAGDVLLLPQPATGAAVELLVDGAPILAGCPVVCDGRYGLRVTQPAAARDNERPTKRKGK